MMSKYGFLKMVGENNMKAFGYSYNSDELLELSECTLECTLEEIESLAFFLTKFKNKVATGIEDGIWADDKNVFVHDHFVYQTEKLKSDFIVVTKINQDDQSGDDDRTKDQSGGRFYD